jgi:hypothetical protein
MLTHQAIFFFRRYKNNKSTGVFLPPLSLSHSLSLFLSFIALRSTANRCCDDILFLCTRMRIFVQSNQTLLFLRRSSSGRKNVVVVVTAFDKSRLLCSSKRTPSFINKSIAIEIFVCLGKRFDVVLPIIAERCRMGHTSSKMIFDTCR